MRKHFLIIAALIALPLATFVFMASDEAPISMANRPVGFREEMLSDRVSLPAKLFIKTCAQCHDLPDPKMHASGEWRPVVTRMMDRLQRRKAFSMESKTLFLPSPEETIQILGYLVNQGFKKASPQTLAETSPEAILFFKTCSQCHGLPDPAQHTGEEWTAVVHRMRGHLRDMKKREISDEESTLILTFLTRREAIP